MLLEYDSSSFCKVTNPNLVLPTVAEPAGGTFSYTGTGTLGIVPNTGLINIAESDSGSYTITYSVGGSSSNFPIAIGNEIILSITTSPGATICTGDTATLTANASGGSGGFTYSWSTGATSQSIDVTTSGNYTVTVTDSDGCSVSAAQQITASTAATAIASINNDAAMSFNGTDQYIQATNSIVTGNNSRSFSLWYKTSSTIAQIPLSIGDPTDTASNSQFAYCLNRVDDSEKAAIFGKANDTNAFDVPNTADGNWHHLVVTYDQSNLKVYIDGNLEATPGLPSSNYATSSGLTIGSWSDNNRYFDGSIDEVAVWDSALSSCDIKGIYEGSIGSNAGKAANLLDANTTIPAPVYWNRMGDS